MEAKPKSKRRKQPPRQNVVGPFVASVRRTQGLSQDALAARCARLGWDLTENGVTKIETQVRCVTDGELFKLALALRVKLVELAPASARSLFRQVFVLGTTVSVFPVRTSAVSTSYDLFVGYESSPPPLSTAGGASIPRA